MLQSYFPGTEILCVLAEPSSITCGYSTKRVEDVIDIRGLQLKISDIATTQTRVLNLRTEYEYYKEQLKKCVTELRYAESLCGKNSQTSIADTATHFLERIEEEDRSLTDRAQDDTTTLDRESSHAASVQKTIFDDENDDWIDE